MILTFAYFYAWKWSIQINKKLGFGTRNEILNSCTCTLLMNIVAFIIELPLEVYGTFIVEQKHGFNKQVRS